MTTTELTAEICAAQVLSVFPLLHRFIQTEMRRHGQPFLSLSQLRVLGFLRFYPKASLSEVADYLDVAPSTMSAMIERLVQRGLVQRSPDPQERRRVVLTLTETGRDCFAQVFDATNTEIAELLNSFSKLQLSQLMQGLNLIETALLNVDN